MKSVLLRLRRTQTKLTTTVLTVILGVTVGIFITRQTSSGTTSYTILELSGTAGGGEAPSRLNNLGDVAGKAGDSLSGENRAVIWMHDSFQPADLGELARGDNAAVAIDDTGAASKPAALRNLAKFSGGDYSLASAINDAGEVAGAANTPTSIVPVVWTATGGLQPVPMLPGHNCGQAFGINKKGHVVGYSSGRNGSSAFLWTPAGGVRNLGVLPGGNHSRACAINDADEVAGTSASAAGEHAVLWMTTGEIRDLGTLPGDTSSEATAMNNAGDVVGYSSGARGLRAFLWTKTTGMQALGVLPGGNTSRALSINSLGQVVGSSTSSSGDRAFIWTKRTGLRDLNAAISKSLGVVFVEADSINDVGNVLVLGKAATSSQDHECSPAPPLSFLLAPGPAE
jgi:probable HAF family extracellular repeat protein